MKIERMLSIIILLLDREIISASQLAEKFSVSKRTILRDIETLEYAGFPIISKAGRNGGFSLIESYKLKNLTFSESEKEQLLQILALKNELIEFTDDQSVLLEKIKLLKITDEGVIGSLAIGSATLHRKAVAKESTVKLKQINLALTNKKKMLISYVGLSGSRTNRKILPLRIVLESGSWYLEAFCELRQELRFFKITRMRTLEILEESFDYKKTGWQEASKPNLLEIQLLFTKNQLGKLYDYFVEDEIELTEAGILVTFSDWMNRSLLPFLLAFGDQVEIIYPESYREEHLKIIERMNQIYDKK